MISSVKLEDGKYELRFDDVSGALCAYRYGEPWQDFTGNKFIYLLMQAALAPAQAVPAPAVPKKRECSECHGKGWNDAWKKVSGHHMGGEVFREDCNHCEGSGHAG